LSYEFYKVIHVLCVVLFVGAIAAQFFSENAPKSTKIISGVASLLILVAGMGLLARVGIGHGEGWPLWVKVKLGLWIAITALGPILAKRLKEKRHLAYYGIVVLVFIAIYMAVNKVS
jgi:uncharacterized membrane protein SirB2